MGLRERLKGLRIRTIRTWRAWRGGKPRLLTWDDLSVDEQAEIKHQMRLTWEDMDHEVRETLMDKLQDDVEQEIGELNESFRGGNGHD